MRGPAWVARAQAPATSPGFLLQPSARYQSVARTAAGYLPATHLKLRAAFIKWISLQTTWQSLDIKYRGV